MDGFAYQIKVFVFYMLSMSENMHVELLKTSKSPRAAIAKVKKKYKKDKQLLACKMPQNMIETHLQYVIHWR